MNRVLLLRRLSTHRCWWRAPIRCWPAAMGPADAPRVMLDAKVKDLPAKMTLAEKIDQIQVSEGSNLSGK